MSIPIANDSSIEGAMLYHLYILAGQSNMDGMGYISDLADELKRNSKALIYNPNRKGDGEDPEVLTG